jgi:Flp pilus assembly protein TadB
MFFDGIIIGLSAFIIIGIFHPLVIRGEYYFGVSIWFLFLILGIIFCVISIFIHNLIISAVLSVAGFSCFWSILEIFRQRERVKKGWYPENPKRKNRKG